MFLARISRPILRKNPNLRGGEVLGIWCTYSTYGHPPLKSGLNAAKKRVSTVASYTAVLQAKIPAVRDRPIAVHRNLSPARRLHLQPRRRRHARPQARAPGRRRRRRRRRRRAIVHAIFQTAARGGAGRRRRRRRRRRPAADDRAGRGGPPPAAAAGLADDRAPSPHPVDPLPPAAVPPGGCRCGVPPAHRHCQHTAPLTQALPPQEADFMANCFRQSAVRAPPPPPPPPHAAVAICCGLRAAGMCIRV